jgi:predicted DNA-binding protein
MSESEEELCARHKRAMRCAGYHISSIVESYIESLEGSEFSADKTRYIKSRMDESAESGKNLTLCETYDEYFSRKGKEVPESLKGCRAEKAFWCPDSLKDTDDAFDTVERLENLSLISDLIKEKQKIMEPILEKRKLKAIEYYASEAAAVKDYDGGKTVSQYISDVHPAIVSVADAKTGRVVAVGRIKDGALSAESERLYGGKPILKLSEIDNVPYEKKIGRRSVIARIFVDAGDEGKWD